MLEISYPSLEVIPNRRWVHDGKLISSGGISSGIHMSLYLLSCLTSRELAIKTTKQMEFEWNLKISDRYK